MLYVLRHAEAGDKHLWLGPDAGRPLTPFGRLQSATLVSTLSQYPIDRIVSSPTARCIQTVDPLARARGVPIELDPDLAVDSTADAMLALAARLAGDAAVLCTHGEVIGDFLHAVLGDGLARRPGGRARWPKGSVWVLDGIDGRSAARYLPPDPD